MIASLRHLRIIQAVAQTRSITRAAQLCHVSQPAVSSALSKLESHLDTRVFDRRAQAVTPAGAALVLRITRALAILDPALAEVAPRLLRTATMAQLTALIAVVESENYSAAARQLGLAQPTIHRAIGHMQIDAGRDLFDRTPYGVTPARAVAALAVAARLAMAEMDQAQAEIADLQGRDIGRVVIGAMPLSRSVLIGRAIATFRQTRMTTAIRVVEGPYAELVLGLRRGEIDVLVGALRPPMQDLIQTELFQDRLSLVARVGHPLQNAQLGDLAAQAWIVPPQGTPARRHFAAMFGGAEPVSLVETGSLVLTRDLLERSDHLAFVSSLQVAADVAAGRLTALGPQPLGTERPIGLTLRRDWQPTPAQSAMIDALHQAARAVTVGQNP